MDKDNNPGTNIRESSFIMMCVASVHITTTHHINPS
jgi:hypothetical protein